VKSDEGKWNTVAIRLRVLRRAIFNENAYRSHWATLRSQPANAADKEKTCRAYAASSYESVTLRQAAAKCADGERNLALLDSEINAFNDLLANKCGS
jgi:hypothetical protein